MDYEVISALDANEQGFQCIIIIRNRDDMKCISELLSKRSIVEVVKEYEHLHHFVIRDTNYVGCAALTVKIGARHLSLVPELPETVVRAEMVDIMEYVERSNNG